MLNEAHSLLLFGSTVCKVHIIILYDNKVLTLSAKNEGITVYSLPSVTLSGGEDFEAALQVLLDDLGIQISGVESIGPDQNEGKNEVFVSARMLSGQLKPGDMVKAKWSGKSEIRKGAMPSALKTQVLQVLSSERSMGRSCCVMM